MPSKDAAKESLAEYEERLYGCVSRAVRRWFIEIAPRIATASKRLRASAICDLIGEEVRKEFDDEDGMRLFVKYERILVSIAGELVIRFKKLDRRFRTANYPTQTALQFDNAQPPLPLGIVPPGERITIGYKLDRAEIQLESVWVLQQRDGGIEWLYPITPTLADVKRLPQPSKEERRVTARRQPADTKRKKKDGGQPD